MMGAIGTHLSAEELLQRVHDAPAYTSCDFVNACSTPIPYQWTGAPNPLDLADLPHALPGVPRVAVVDLGVKYNILRELKAEGLDPIVLPCNVSAEEILSVNPDGVVFTPGPGDPARLGYAIDATKALIGKRPMFGICLGHQMLAHALGGSTFKLKFGHRGSNHPVRDLETGRVYITSQNHGFAVDPTGLEGSGAVVTQININDGTVEALRHRDADIYSIQYHPEASPGPHDSAYLFHEFASKLKGVGM
jgi:carbamoyl-phosphate synthase small subunit